MCCIIKQLNLNTCESQGYVFQSDSPLKVMHMTTHMAEFCLQASFWHPYQALKKYPISLNIFLLFCSKSQDLLQLVEKLLTKILMDEIIFLLEQTFLKK